MPDDMVGMQAAATKALELDPLLAEAHGALGMVYAREALWDRSEKSFRRALELNPNDSVLYGNFALTLLFPLGRIGEAVSELRRGVKHDPVAARIRYILVNALIAAGRFDEAVVNCQKLPEDFPARSDWLARARMGQGQIGEAIRILEEARRSPGLENATSGYLGYAYARAGRREEAAKLAAQVQDPYNLALIFAGMGDREHTIAELLRMAPLGPPRFGRNVNYPEFAFVRGDPRIKAQRKSLGLPE
jgi:Flp pilus assembly protein TadD